MAPSGKIVFFDKFFYLSVFTNNIIYFFETLYARAGVVYSVMQVGFICIDSAFCGVERFKMEARVLIGRPWSCTEVDFIFSQKFTAENRRPDPGSSSRMLVSSARDRGVPNF